MPACMKLLVMHAAWRACRFMVMQQLLLKKAPSKLTSVSFTNSYVILYAPACGWQTAKNGWMKKVPILEKRKNKYRLIIKSTTHRVPRSQLTTRFTKSDTTTKGAHPVPYMLTGTGCSSVMAGRLPVPTPCCTISSCDAASCVVLPSHRRLQVFALGRPV